MSLKFLIAKKARKIKIAFLADPKLLADLAILSVLMSISNITKKLHFHKQSTINLTWVLSLFLYERV